MNRKVTFHGGSRDGHSLQLELKPDQLEVTLPRYSVGFQRFAQPIQELYRRRGTNVFDFNFVREVQYSGQYDR